MAMMIMCIVDHACRHTHTEQLQYVVDDCKRSMERISWNCVPSNDHGLVIMSFPLPLPVPLPLPLPFPFLLFPLPFPLSDQAKL